MLTISVSYRIISDMPCPACDKKCLNHNLGFFFCNYAVKTWSIVPNTIRLSVPDIIAISHVHRDYSAGFVIRRNGIPILTGFFP